jgi:DNA-binding transcriptional ArsR family regulator
VTDLDWQALAEVSIHPLRLRILKRAASTDGKFSPVELAAEFGEPLGNVSYHVRELREAGLVRPAGTTPRRGAVQHYYKVAAKALR